MIDDRAPFDGGRGWIAGGLIAGVVGSALFVLALFVDRAQAFASWLTAYNYVLTIVLGMLAFLITAHAMNATWPVAVRRVAEAVIGAMPLLVVLFIPLFFSVDDLYPWAHPERIVDAHVRALVEHKRPWMNRGFWTGRTIFYLALFTIVCELLRWWSLRADARREPPPRNTMLVFSSALAPAVGLALTFASFDWIMSLSPDFYSTMFGLYYFAGGFLAAVALLAVLVTMARRRGHLSGVNPSHYYALGRLLLAFTVFWAYIAYFQFFLVWIANKPLEARYFVDRFHRGFQGVGGFLVFGHFALPFLVLLSYWMKRRAALVTAVSLWLIAVHYFDVHWMIAPQRLRAGAPFKWIDAAALLAVGGLTIAFTVWRQRGHLLAAASDPLFEKALEYKSV